MKKWNDWEKNKIFKSIQKQRPLFLKAVNAYPPLFEALGLPPDHLAYGAVMLGYPEFQYPRIPIRNRPRVTWK